MRTNFQLFKSTKSCCVGCRNLPHICTVGLNKSFQCNREINWHVSDTQKCKQTPWHTFQTSSWSYNPSSKKTRSNLFLSNKAQLITWNSHVNLHVFLCFAKWGLKHLWPVGLRQNCFDQMAWNQLLVVPVACEVCERCCKKYATPECRVL